MFLTLTLPIWSVLSFNGQATQDGCVQSEHVFLSRHAIFPSCYFLFDISIENIIILCWSVITKSISDGCMVVFHARKNRCCFDTRSTRQRGCTSLWSCMAVAFVKLMHISLCKCVRSKSWLGGWWVAVQRFPLAFSKERQDLNAASHRDMR